MTDYSYVGTGQIYLKEVGALAGLLAIGNCSALALAISEDVKELKDFTAAGGGTYNEVRRIGSVEATISAHDFSPENLSKALFGTSTAIAAGTVTDEVVPAYAGAIAPTLYQIDTAVVPVVDSQAGTAAAARVNSTVYALNAYMIPASANGYFYKVTIAGTSGASIPTFPIVAGATVADGTCTLTCMGKISLVAATDFNYSGSGIVFTSTARITGGENYLVDYTKKAGNVIEALTSSAKEYELVFEGLNEARSGKPVTVHAYRVKLGAVQNLGLITEDFGVLELTGKLLKDTSKTGNGISQYFKVKVAA